jgi:hypothetical protein
LEVAAFNPEYYIDTHCSTTAGVGELQMETFKIVVDGVKLSAKQRKQIEAGFEKVFLEALGPTGEDEVKIGPFPKVGRMKKPLINGLYALRRAKGPEMKEKLDQIGRAGLVEQAALQPATFEALDKIDR